MSFESFTGVLASVMGVAMAMSPLLQARRVHQLRDSSEVSVGFFLIIIVGSVVWCLRGIVTLDPVIIVPNVVAFAVELVTLAVVLRYRPPSRPTTAAPPACAPAAVKPHAAGASRRRHRRAGVRR